MLSNHVIFHHWRPSCHFLFICSAVTATPLWIHKKHLLGSQIYSFLSPVCLFTGYKTSQDGINLHVSHCGQPHHSCFSRSRALSSHEGPSCLCEEQMRLTLSEAHEMDPVWCICQLRLWIPSPPCAPFPFLKRVVGSYSFILSTPFNLCLIHGISTFFGSFHLLSSSQFISCYLLVLIGP